MWFCPEYAPASIAYCSSPSGSGSRGLCTYQSIALCLSVFGSHWDLSRPSKPKKKKSPWSSLSVSCFPLALSPIHNKTATLRDKLSIPPRSFVTCRPHYHRMPASLPYSYCHCNSSVAFEVRQTYLSIKATNTMYVYEAKISQVFEMRLVLYSIDVLFDLMPPVHGRPMFFQWSHDMVRPLET